MIGHLVGGGPMDEQTVSVSVASRAICVPYGLTPFGPFYTLKYEMEAVDPDGLLATYRFAGWPEELALLVQEFGDD